MTEDISNLIEPLKTCIKCNNTNITSTPNNIWHECSVINCNFCGNKWYICVQHQKKFGIKSFARMNKHFKDFHSSKTEFVRKQQNIDIMSENEDTDNLFIDIEDSNRDEQILNKKRPPHEGHSSICKKMKSGTDSLKITNQYFLDEFNLKGSGVCGLAGSAFQMCNQGLAYTPMKEAMFHMDLTNFLTKIPVSQQNKLIDLLNRARNIEMQCSRIPRTTKDVNLFYLKSKYSIYKNIPTPKVNAYDNHACVSLEDILENILALGSPISMMKSSQFNEINFDNSNLLKTQKAKDILMQTYERYQQEVDPYVVFVVIWSDDFEVNHTRKNKSSTWLKTVTFVHDDTNMSKGCQYTYALCIGNKKDSHFLVNKWYNEELIRLNEVIYKYSSYHSKEIPVVTRVLVMSADRPERCTLNDIASYSSNTTKRWMFSNGSNPFKMSSCKQCFQRRVINMFQSSRNDGTNSVCKKCSDFNFNEKIKTNAFTPPKEYPRTGNTLRISNEENVEPPTGRESIDKLHDGYLYPLQLSYKGLNKGLKYALYNHLKGIWKKKETIVYLKILGMKDSTILDMIEKANSNLKVRNDVIEAIFHTNFPPMWTTILTLDQFIETPMHHLFEGLVKSSIEVLIVYFKFHKKWAKFARLVNDILDDVSSLNLSYCAVDSFSNEEDFKTGGWLAENYLGFSRIMIILIGHFDEFIHPDELGFIEIQSMFQSLFALLSRLMTKQQPDICMIENHIKLFLSICHFYEKDIGFEGNKNNGFAFPFWYRKSNFVSLLNLSKQIEQYGPVRLHWEGLKEKFIQKVKPFLSNKRTRVSYLVTKLEKIHRQNNFDSIVNNHVLDETTYYERISEFQRFKSLNELDECLKNFESFSGVVMKSSPNKIFIVHDTNDEIRLHRVKFSSNDRFLKSNLWFYSVSIKNNPTYIFNEYKILDEEIHDCVMLVAYFPGDNFDQNGYTVISKNWQVYDIERGFYQYEPSYNFLSTIISKN